MFRNNNIYPLIDLKKLELKLKTYEKSNKKKL